MNTPNLDDMLDHLQESESGFSTKEQRAELIALKQRCEDLELMLREAGDGWLRRLGPSGKQPWERRWILSTAGGEIVMSPEEDGLPALNPEAREALRKR